MKLLVISDLHGSVSATTFALEQFKKQNCNDILCLGDILYHGPRNDLPTDYNPKKVIELLNSHKENIISIRGNCDSEVDQMVLEFPITADYNQFFIGNHRVFITHGHIYSPQHLPPLKSKSIFLSGHTHIPNAFKNDHEIYLCNPGSLTLPKMNHPKTFAILEDNYFTIYTTDNKKYMGIRF